MEEVALTEGCEELTATKPSSFYQRAPWWLWLLLIVTSVCFFAGLIAAVTYRLEEGSPAPIISEGDNKLLTSKSNTTLTNTTIGDKEEKLNDTDTEVSVVAIEKRPKIETPPEEITTTELAVFITDEQAQEITTIETTEPITDEPVYLDCEEARQKGQTTTRTYLLNPDGGSIFKARCEMETLGGGWTTIQRRINGKVEFFLDWDEYARGFGDLEGDYWIGNDNINRLTHGRGQQLYVRLKNVTDSVGYARYNKFYIANSTDNYRLEISGFSKSESTLDDSMTHADTNNDQIFATKDRQYTGPKTDVLNKTLVNCATEWGQGAWWYGACGDSNLNGVWKRVGFKGIWWRRWFDGFTGLIGTEMMIRSSE